MEWDGDSYLCTRQIFKHVVVKVEMVSETDGLQGVPSSNVRPRADDKHTLTVAIFKCSALVGLCASSTTQARREGQSRPKKGPGCHLADCTWTGSPGSPRGEKEMPKPGSQW